MPKLNDAFRDQLTPEEVAAFEAENEDDAAEALESLANPAPEDPDAAAAAARAADDDGEDGGEDGGDDGDAAAKDVAAKAAADEGARDEKVDPADKEAKPKPVEEPQIDPRAAQETLEAAKDKRKQLRDAYNDGDLTDDEFETEMDKVDGDVARAGADLETAKRRATSEQNEWKQAGADYLTKYPGLKADGIIQALDKTVADLAQYPTLANLPHDQFLERVHKKLLADAEFTGLDIPPLGDQPAKPANPKAPEGDPSLGKTPRTLANTPASDVSTLDDSPYASLERLSESDPIAFENAMLKLPQDKRDEFASLAIG